MNVSGTSASTTSLFGGTYQKTQVARDAFYLSVALILNLVTIAQRSNALSMSLVTCTTFYVVKTICFPGVRTSRMYERPLYWMNFVFFLQLVFIPTLVNLTAPAVGRLTHIASPHFMNLALAANALAFLGYGLGTLLVLPTRAGVPNNPWRGMRLGYLYAFIGVVGIALFFRNLQTLFEYFTNPALWYMNRGESEASLLDAASTFMRPFGIFACVLMWTSYVEGRRLRTGTANRAPWATLLVCLGVLLVSLSFNFNRSSFVAPFGCIVTVYSKHIWRFTNRRATLIAVFVLVFYFIVGAYRAYRPSEESGLAVITSSYNDGMLQELNEQLQVYGSGPQFAGLLLEAENWPSKLYYGTTLVGSLLYPVPIIGERFRESSGVNLFNSHIYGYTGTIDQIVPFQGELVINFGIFCVPIVFFLIGTLFRYLDNRFAKSVAMFESYAWMYASIWVSFLVIGSLAVLMQIVVFFGMPLYLYAGLRRVGYL